jgi:hypothetical protein
LTREAPEALPELRVDGMTKLITRGPSLDHDKVRAIRAKQRDRLSAPGWVRERGGKHQVKMVKPGKRPCRSIKGKTYSKGLDAAIRRQAGL